MIRRMRAVALVLVAALALSGCSSSNSTGSSDSSGGGAKPSPQAELKPVAKATGKEDPHIHADINSVTVSGGMTTINFTVYNDKAEKGIGGHWQVADRFATEDYVAPVDDQGNTAEDHSFANHESTNGVKLEDPDSKTVYRPAYDSAMRCLCSTDLATVLIPQGGQAVLYASYAPLPEGVDKVTVTFPGFDPVENVPVTRDKPAAAVTAKSPTDQHVLASRSTVADVQKATVELNSVIDANGSTFVSWSVTNNDDSRIQVSDAFSSGRYESAVDESGGSGDSHGDVANGVVLVDGANRHAYHVAYDKSEDCLCSDDLSAAFISPGQTVTFFATFAQLPEGTDSVAVHIPTAGVFDNVPVTRVGDRASPSEDSKGSGDPRVPKVGIVAPRLDTILVTSTDDDASTTTRLPGGVRTTLAGDVNFEVDSDQLTDRARQILDGLAEEWSDEPPEAVTIIGHTDSVADDAHNLDLSKRRAQAVADYLGGKVPGLDIAVDGKGESQPVADESGDNVDAARAANRRVEITAKTSSSSTDGPFSPTGGEDGDGEPDGRDGSGNPSGASSPDNGASSTSGSGSGD
ncbi:MAG: OmpA family protein [Actinomycetaceae bacterium]|nr:OmpA family protein [Actinomycetaceae bacterium]